MDVFSGIGTTGLGCNNRNYIGFELNEKYAEFSKKRLNGEQLEEWVVCQYDLDDNLIACYKNRDEASKATGVESGDIMRTYNRTKFESRGGYKWKLEQRIWKRQKQIQIVQPSGLNQKSADLVFMQKQKHQVIKTAKIIRNCHEDKDKTYIK